MFNYNTGNWTEGLACARQELYHWVTVPAPKVLFFKPWFHQKYLMFNEPVV